MFRVGVAIVLSVAGCHKLLDLTEIPQPPIPDAPDAPDAPPPPMSWASGDGGWYHACGIREDGTLWCWGRNNHGQLGVPSSTLAEQDHPLQVGTDTWISVSADEHFTCGVKTDHTLWCWGNNGQGALGAGNTDNMEGPIQIDGTSWLAVTAGFDFACGIDMAGQVECWGGNTRNQLANGSPDDLPHKPIVVTGTWKAVAAGGQHACAIDTADRAWCWGNNGYGESGTGPISSPPTQIGGDTYTKLALGDELTCGLTTAGHLRCWGQGTYGSLGNDATQSSNVPVMVDHDSGGWIDVDAGDLHACARKQSGALYCWGDNSHDNLGVETQTLALSTLPTPISGGADSYAALALGPSHTCAIAAADHVMWCAGRAGGGQLGTTGSHLAPVQVAGTWSIVALSNRITCAIDANTSHLSCWGDNGSGTLGDGTHIDRKAPHPAMSTLAWAGITVGEHACGLDSAAHLYCWGPNYNFQLGDGTTNEHTTPTLTSLGTAAVGPVSVTDHTCVLSGTAATCWGQNYYHQAGTGANPTPPTAITGNYDKIASGLDQTCAQISGGGIACWGDNEAGELGLGDASTHSGPQTMTAITGVVDELVSGEDHTCALQNGTLYCWGWNISGQIGNMTTNTALAPFVVPPVGSATWTSVGVGKRHTCAVDSDHHLYCWGRNESGQLGLGTFTEHHEPTLVGSDADWVSVVGGEHHTCAFKTDGSLWCWGGNTAGEVGDGTGWRPDLQVVQ